MERPFMLFIFICITGGLFGILSIILPPQPFLCTEFPVLMILVLLTGSGTCQMLQPFASKTVW